MRLPLFFFASAVTLGALAPRALAQTPPPEAPPPATPPVLETPPPPLETSPPLETTPPLETPPPPPPPGAVTTAPPPFAPAPMPVVAPADAPEPWRDEPRLRIGISTAVGPAAGDYPGWMLAPAMFRVGVQIIEEVSIIYQNTAFLMFFDAPGSSADSNLVDQNAILGLVTLADIVDLGGGIALDVFDTSDGPDVAPGIQGRVAVNLGPGRNQETGRRIAFNLSADVHATFIEDEAVIVFPFGLGAEFF
jgi:hypothetical protein